MKPIKQYTLSEKDSSSILIYPLNEVPLDARLKEPHRDDYYLLLMALEGNYHLKLDFEDVMLTAPFILCIEPGQVHQMVRIDKVKGWVLGIEEFMLEPEFLGFLNTELIAPMVLKKDARNLESLLTLTYNIQNTANNIYTSKAILFLLNALFCLLFDETSTKIQIGDSKEKRKYIIEQDFKKLVRRNFRTWKKPSQYALELAISTAHLNDTIKDTTGFPVSYHIQHQNIVEAKRLLYSTDLDIQQIAFELGYADNVYFGKLFKKTCAISPLAFRKQFRD